jgi:hypothetical protein
MEIVNSSNDPLDRLNYSLETMLCSENVVMKNANVACITFTLHQKRISEIRIYKERKKRKEKKVIKGIEGRG